MQSELGEQVEDQHEAVPSSECLLGILEAGGLSDQTAAWAVDLIPLYVTAVAFEENVQRADQWSPEDLERFLDGLRSYFASLPADRFPLTMALAGPLTSGAAGDDRFEFGISVITAGLASLAERH
ncbi:TetR/AcrR family transcriptional regulator C-terminal domain-containing protein [Kribbella sindirgiensis]|uniref:Tetracycline repressor TetR C-terminal domain-containing protein n=1 Tax=Kribbella sindirgiensis TaxID=1124744 RepID=A0A4R0IPY3_9ACTN|nr:TetR/AcrR family transcriptional regulator C-terminal domain-containing protein [Kribbella sindirgiensis]TCC33486.1 hypothetical protein E0H50_16070 [Kribbella sindirgiensis]